MLLPLVRAAEDGAADGRLSQAEVCGHSGAREADLLHGPIAEKVPRPDEGRKGGEAGMTSRGSGIPPEGSEGHHPFLARC